MEQQQVNIGSIVDLVLRAVALAMSIATVVLGLLDAASLETRMTLLGIGLFALALAALQKADVE
jgi:hypothetical protein